MKNVLLAAVALLAMGGTGNAASAVNLGTETVTIAVTEGGDRSELTIAPGETVEFCPNACFVTMPNGDREALTGSETIEISGGAAKIR
jgi:plastocyanin